MEKLDNDIQEICEYQIDPKYVLDKLTELEDRSCQNNLRIDEIKETKGETWNDCKENVQDMFAQKLGKITNLNYTTIVSRKKVEN